MSTMLSIMELLLFIYICIIDLKNKIIHEKSVFLILISGIVRGLLNSNMEGYYLGVCSYPMPLILLYIMEDYFKRELIGFGDIKLLMGIGGLLSYRNIGEIVRFYQVVYIVSGISVVILYPYFKYRGKRLEYIPFAPFIVIGYFIFIKIFR